MLGSVFGVNSSTNIQALLPIHGNAFNILLCSQSHMYVNNTNGIHFGFPRQQC
jgi:hypothetical protein